MPDLAGRELPSGTARLEPYQNWLLHDAFYSQPRPEPHPVAAFILANRGIGVSLADLLALFGSDINDGPLLADPNPIHFDQAAARRLAGTGQVVNQGPSTMALGVNMLLAAFPGARLVSYRVRLLGLVLGGDSVEGGGTVFDREILDGQERVRCQLHLDVPGRGRVIEGEAVLVLPPIN
jgi:hypothetical protein